MNCVTVSMKDIKKDNPTLCLNPIRYLNKCQNCVVYHNYYERKKYKTPKAKIKCKPRIQKGYLKAKRKLELNRLKILKAEQKFRKKYE